MGGRKLPKLVCPGSSGKKPQVKISAPTECPSWALSVWEAWGKGVKGLKLQQGHSPTFQVSLGARRGTARDQRMGNW